MFSLFMTAFMLGGVPGLPCTFDGPSARFGAASAGFLVEEDMKATFAARSGRRAVVGLAIQSCQFLLEPRSRMMG